MPEVILACRQCGRKVNKNPTGRCQRCGAVYDSEPRTRPPAQRPKPFEVLRKDGLAVRWKWSQCYSFFDGFDLPDWLDVFPDQVAIFLLILFCGWWFPALSRNSTRITVRDGRLTVRHGPVPWPGKRDLDRRDIEQVYATAPGTEKAAGRGVRLKVRLAPKGKQVTLIRRLPSLEAAWFLEQELERELGIRDTAEPGEASQEFGPP